MFLFRLVRTKMGFYALDDRLRLRYGFWQANFASQSSDARDRTAKERTTKTMIGGDSVSIRPRRAQGARLNAADLGRPDAVAH
jgi:phage major head subunit gpT-like protein